VGRAVLRNANLSPNYNPLRQPAIPQPTPSAEPPHAARRQSPQIATSALQKYNTLATSKIFLTTYCQSDYDQLNKNLYNTSHHFVVTL
jgi:hypothetical protein